MEKKESKSEMSEKWQRTKEARGESGKVVKSESKVEKWQKAKEGESESRSGTGHVQKWPLSPKPVAAAIYC